MKKILLTGLWSSGVLCLSLAINSCKKLGLCKDGEFSFSRIDNMTNSLKLHGYYYGTNTHSNTVYIYILFGNGIFYKYYSVSPEDAQSGNISIDIGEKEKQTKKFWGIYKIEGGNIEIQSWSILSYNCLPVYVEKGKIVDDSTFQIIEWKELNGKNIYPINDTFHFHSYSPKPDSVVSFIP